MTSNPFFELYAGDRITPADYVKLFSPVLIPHAVPVFAPGNAVVTGRQGSGKSMLLSLLKPEIRLQYHSQVNEDFPIPHGQRKFLSASVNLAHSHAIDFGLRSAGPQSSEQIQLFFADFLNYLIVNSLLKCIKIYAFASAKVRREVGLRIDSSSIDKLAPIVSSLAVWDGWLGTCNTFENLLSRTSDRISIYRDFLHDKRDGLYDDFRSSRTPIGEPILRMSEALRAEGLIDDDTQFFIDIDQYEELENIITDHIRGELVDYRAVINKALANRNAESVSYRIGTRAHAWVGHGKILGSHAKLEKERDYKYVELDEILVRKEHTKNDIFRAFAEDVFKRRMHFTPFEVDGIQSPIDHVYGRFTPEEKARRLSLRAPATALRMPRGVRPEIWQRILELSKGDLLSAKLGEIWLRQKGDVVSLQGPDEKLPWNEKPYWKKERKDIAFLQLASDASQKPLWGGAPEIIGLAGGNILVFLSLNQYIWDTWNLFKARDAVQQETLPEIDIQIQSVGVLKASKSWVEKITEETGSSSERARFIEVIGEFFAKQIFGDKKVSNPGHNGFSVLVAELAEVPDIRRKIEEMADYGNLFKLPHTTKNSDRRNRAKFYLNPIFCPHYGIPFVRTKEPFYAKLSLVAEWMSLAGYDVKFGIESQQHSLRLD